MLRNQRKKIRLCTLFFVIAVAVILLFRNDINKEEDDKKESNNDEGEVHADALIMTSKATLSELINYLYQLNIFLLDISCLQEINSKQGPQKLSEFNSYISIEEELVKFKQYYQEQSTTKTNHLVLTFGLLRANIENANKVKSFAPIETQCLVKVGNDMSSVYVVCVDFMLNIVIVDDRGSYYWIGKQEQEEDVRRALGKEHYFGDVPRALSRFELGSVRDMTHSLMFQVPLSLESFLFEYEQSKFVECSSAEKKPTSASAKDMGVINTLKKAVGALSNLRIHYWLGSNTIIGWYRNCTLLKNDSLISLGLWHKEYTPEIDKWFLGNGEIALWETFGYVNDSYKLRLLSGESSANEKTIIEMSLFYRLNTSHVWYGKTKYKQKYMHVLKDFSKLCSTDLLGTRFTVPCNFAEYLDQEYGKDNWRKASDDEYTFRNMIYRGNWSELEWPRAVRFYNTDGSPDELRASEYTH